MENKQIELVKSQTEKALNAVESITVNSDETMLEAGDILKRVKTVGKMIKEEKEKATKPLNESLKTIRGWFAPIEESYEQAQSLISKKMLVYQSEQESIREKVAEENALKQKEKEENPESKVRMTTVPQVIHKSEDFHTRSVPKMRIIDIEKIPDEYWIVDEVKLRKDVVSGKIVSGAEYYEEKILV